jgi:hypothetical protein
MAAVQYTFTHKQHTEPQNTQNGTYITINIVKLTKEHVT